MCAHLRSTLNDQCDTCGHPFVDKMVLDVFGTKYEFSNAIISSFQAPTLSDYTCSLLPRIGDKVPARAAYAYEGNEYEHHRNLTKVDMAHVYYGTMTVNSRLHDIKYQQGIFQFVGAIDAATARPVSYAEAKNTYVLEPYKLELSFFKPKSYY